MDAVTGIETIAATFGAIAGIIAAARHARNVARSAGKRLTTALDERLEQATIRISAPVVAGLDRTERVLSAHIEDCRQDRESMRWQLAGLEKQMAYSRGKADGAAESPSQVEAHLHIDQQGS